MRTLNYGTATLCNDRRGHYRLDTRRNTTHDTPPRFGTQFLYPKDDVRKKDPFAVWYHSVNDTSMYVPSADGGWRMWRKSDPMFTGAYDRESVKYILDSEEGRKYFQFYSRFLMGSEEHYFSSLFYNWDRTRSFVTSLSAQTQYNTWRHGLYFKVTDGFKMHTHYLNISEIHMLRGMAKRGVFFARKFTAGIPQTSDLLNMIDEQLLGIDCKTDTFCRRPKHNLIPKLYQYDISGDAGKYWPGYSDVPMDLSMTKAQFDLVAKRSGEEIFPVSVKYIRP